MEATMENGWTERIEELEAEVAKLTAERDADRRREYGYSQQTVDALTAERDSLKHLYDKALGDLVKDSQRISELEAENTRLRMLRDAAESRAQGLEAANKRLRAFWEWSRLADKMTFEQYPWIGKEASHEG
jgi:chromosome segregation ATPase